MSRYTYYHVLYVGMINIMMFVPTLLIKNRYDGAVSGMLIAVIIGTILSLTTMSCFEKFPGLGFPELCDRYLPAWLTNVINMYAAICIWLPAGMIVIYAYSETVRTFFYPDMNPYFNLLLMVSAAVWACSRTTRSIQYIQEILMIVSSPLLIMFVIKAITNRNLDWNAIRYMAGYITEPPSFMAVVSSTFLFSGYLSLVVFNRLHTKGFKFRFRWIVPLFGTFFLAVTFFIPIGFHGTVGVEKFVYLWSMTADSMLMEYGFINRVLYVFLLLFTGLSLLFVMNTWHMTILLTRHTFTRAVAVEEEPLPRFQLWLAAAAGVLAFGYMKVTSLEINEIVSRVWIIARFFTEIALLFLMLYFVRRRRKENVWS